LNECTGDSYILLLATEQHTSMITDDSVVTIGKLENEAMEIGSDISIDNIIVVYEKALAHPKLLLNRN
jgi:hypothetical protein